MTTLLTKDKAPTACAYLIRFPDELGDYQSITTPIGVTEHVFGEPMIERFAKDQYRTGRDFLVGLHAGETYAEILVHKKHLITADELFAERRRAYKSGQKEAA